MNVEFLLFENWVGRVQCISMNNIILVLNKCSCPDLLFLIQYFLSFEMKHYYKYSQCSGPSIDHSIAVFVDKGDRMWGYWARALVPLSSFDRRPLIGDRTNTKISQNRSMSCGGY